jgi:hypothetical protein
MFAEHLPKFQRISRRTMFGIAAAAAVTALIVAMGVVAEGQVKSAQLREAQLADQRAALAQCLESARGAARASCALQGYTSGRGAGSAGQTSGSPLTVSRSAGHPPSQGLLGVALVR